MLTGKARLTAVYTHTHVPAGNVCTSHQHLKVSDQDESVLDSGPFAVFWCEARKAAQPMRRLKPAKR